MSRVVSSLVLLLFMVGFPSAKGLAADFGAQRIQLDRDLKQLPLRSEAKASWLFIDVYRAFLYAPQEISVRQLLNEQTPLKLKLCYLREVSKEQFIEAASEALPEKLSPSLGAAVQGLHQAYRSVEAEDCYQLSYSVKQGVVLSLNDRAVYQAMTPGFKALYFGIWLGQAPLSEKVRDALLAPLE